jgi:hypothetical protein
MSDNTQTLQKNNPIPQVLSLQMIESQSVNCFRSRQNMNWIYRKEKSKIFETINIYALES